MSLQTSLLSNPLSLKARDLKHCCLCQLCIYCISRKASTFPFRNNNINKMVHVWKTQVSSPPCWAWPEKQLQPGPARKPANWRDLLSCSATCKGKPIFSFCSLSYPRAWERMCNDFCSGQGNVTQMLVFNCVRSKALMKRVLRRTLRTCQKITDKATRWHWTMESADCKLMQK